MHTYLLVAGDNLDELLWPFSHHKKVEPYEIFFSDEEIQTMAEHYGVLPADLDTLATRMHDWTGEDGFVSEGRLGFVSTENPVRRHDWYKVGGRWANALPLREPRPLRRFFGLLPAGETTRATRAKKFEIDQQALLEDPPAALLFGGEWVEDPFSLSAEGDSEAKWRAEFAQHFCRIPEDTTLTVVDAHS